MTAAASRPHGVLSRYKCGPDENGTEGKPCRCAECRAANRAWKANRARLVAYGQWEPRRDPAGTRRRLGALMCNGWSMGQLSVRSGWHRKVIREFLLLNQWVTAGTAGKVRALYDELWDQPPPEETPYEKLAAAKARRYAREHGFAPPLAWDDDEIDDPAATPAPGWDPAPSPVAEAIRQARGQAGLSRPRLAALIGVTPGAIHWWEQGGVIPSEVNWEQLELALGPLGVVRDRDAGAGDNQQREGEAAA